MGVTPDLAVRRPGGDLRDAPEADALPRPDCGVLHTTSRAPGRSPLPDRARRWLVQQVDGTAWLPAAIGMALAAAGLTGQAVVALACGGSTAGCMLSPLEGVGGLGLVAVPLGLAASLVATSTRRAWPRLRSRALVRVARAVVTAAATCAAAVSGVVALLASCDGGFLCGDDPALASGMATLTGVLLCLAGWSAVARGRWSAWTGGGGVVGVIAAAAVVG